MIGGVFRPKYVLIESFRTLEEDMQSSIAQKMQQYDYKIKGKLIQADNVGTLLFQDRYYYRDSVD